MTSAPHSANWVPIADYGHQDEAFRIAFLVLDQAVREGAFPGASLAVTFQGKLVALKALGRFTYDSVAPLVQPETIYDLASLTKVVATTTAAMILYEQGELDLEMPLAGVVPEFVTDDPRRSEVSFRHLLAHTAGLPAYEKLFLRASSREQLLAAAFRTPLAANPGTRTEYSDIGFIVLAVALERIAGRPLNEFCQQHIFGPLGLTSTTFNPPAGLRSKIPPTVDDQTFRHRVIQGEVNDENASVLGGVAGHAGLFSSANDLATFAHVLLNGGRPILLPETVALFTRRVARAPSPANMMAETPARALGWDVPSPPSQSGKYLSPSSFGHLGYTGTSLWIDPERQLSVTLLTNRTWPDTRNQAIKQVRPRFHDAILEILK